MIGGFEKANSSRGEGAKPKFSLKENTGLPKSHFYAIFAI
jgi:hypothetical protein